MIDLDKKPFRNWVPKNYVYRPWSTTVPPEIRESLDKATLPPPKTLPVYSSEPATDKRYQNYQDSTNFAVRGTSFAPPTPGNAIELSRWYCRFGQMGIIKGYWQWLSWNRQFTARIQNGTPYNPFIQDYFRYDVRWFLRLSQLSMTASLGPLYQGPANTIPGFAFSDSDLYLMRETRFPWGIPGEIFLKVPPGFAVRLFFALDVQSGPRPIGTVGGRLWGYTQSLYTPEAQHNAYMGWQ